MPQYLYKTLCRLYTPGFITFNLNLNLCYIVAVDTGGENWFGVDASLSVSYGPNCFLHGSSHCFFLAMFATRHNSTFLNLKN